MASVELVGQEARALSGAGQAAEGRTEAESQGALSEEQAAGERQTSGESQAAGDDRATTGGNASEGAEEQPSEQERRSERRSGRYNLEAAAALSREYDYKAELTQWRLKGQEHGLTRGEEDFLARVTLGILENGEGDLESRKHRRLFVNGRVGINTLNYGRESREDLRDQALESYVHGYTEASTGSIGEAETFAKWLAKPMGGGESEKERLRNLVGNALWHTPSRAGPGDVEFDHAMDRIVEAVEDHDRATRTGEKRTFTYHNPSGRKNKWEELVEAVHAPDRASLETEVVNYRNLQRMEQARNEENLLLGLGKLALSSWANRVPGAVGEYVRGRHERRLERGYDFKLASNAEHQDAVEAKREERASEKFLESAEKLESAKRQVEALRETMREMLEKREEHSRTEIRQMREEQRKAERESRVAERAAEKHKLEFERAQRQVEYNARMKELALNDPKVVKLMGKHNP